MPLRRKPCVSPVDRIVVVVGEPEFPGKAAQTQCGTNVKNRTSGRRSPSLPSTFRPRSKRPEPHHGRGVGQGEATKRLQDTKRLKCTLRSRTRTRSCRNG